MPGYLISVAACLAAPLFLWMCIRGGQAVLAGLVVAWFLVPPSGMRAR